MTYSTLLSSFNEHTLHSLILFALLAFCVSCGDPGPVPPQGPVESYEIAKVFGPSEVEPEFQFYLLKGYPVFSGNQYESRLIFMGGQSGDNDQNTVVVKRQDGTIIDSKTIALSRASTNYYFDQSSREFVVPLEVTLPVDVAFDTNYELILQLTNGDASIVYGSNTVTLRTTDARSYSIEYLCQGSTYDIRSYAYELQQSIAGAFSTSGTDVPFMAIQSTSVPIHVLQDLTDFGLMQYGDAYVSNGQQHQDNIVCVFSVVDNALPAEELVLGRTARRLVGETYRSYSFVFVERVMSATEDFSEEQRAVLFTRTTIHELGHARRKDMEYTEYADESNHQGKHKSLCAAKQLAEYDPAQAFTFCARHDQIFYNINW